MAAEAKAEVNCRDQQLRKLWQQLDLLPASKEASGFCKRVHRSFLKLVMRTFFCQYRLWRCNSCHSRQAGSNSVIKTSMPRTALHWAALGGDASICSLLLAYRADPHPSFDLIFVWWICQLVLDLQGVSTCIYVYLLYSCTKLVHLQLEDSWRPKVSEALHRRRTRLMQEHRSSGKCNENLWAKQDSVEKSRLYNGWSSSTCSVWYVVVSILWVVLDFASAFLCHFWGVLQLLRARSLLWN